MGISSGAQLQVPGAESYPAAFGILLVNGTETPEWKYVL